MLKIGITGGIGSGKTTVCKVFELLGVPVYYADDEARKLLDDNIVKEGVIQKLGNQILDEKGKIERKKLAALVFNNKKKLEQLNAIIHPAVGIHFENWLKERSAHTYVLKEAAILFESGAYKQVDKVILVAAPTELKIKRVMQRDRITREQVMERIHNQMSDEEKISHSQHVINNDEHTLIIPQVVAIHQQLLKE